MFKKVKDVVPRGVKFVSKMITREVIFAYLKNMLLADTFFDIDYIILKKYISTKFNICIPALKSCSLKIPPPAQWRFITVFCYKTGPSENVGSVASYPFYTVAYNLDDFTFC